MVPIAPHSLHSRALVTGPSDITEVFMDPSSANREATMFIDGEIIPSERPIRRVVVRKGTNPRYFCAIKLRHSTVVLRAYFSIQEETTTSQCLGQTFISNVMHISVKRAGNYCFQPFLL